MKRYLGLIGLFLLPLIPLFLTSDMVHTHDGPVHIARIAAYVKALADGQLPPRWAGELNYGYGTPIFIFMYPLPYLLGSLFVALGANLALSFKLILSTSFVLSGIFFYGWMRALTKNNTFALVTTFVYQFAPYRFAELTVRGSMAEAFGFAFTPLVLWMLNRFHIKPTAGRAAAISLATLLLVLSHNSISLVFFGIICLYVLLTKTSARTKLWSGAALAAGLGLAAFYWIPALIEHRYTYGDLFMKDMFRDHFAPLSQFFLPNFTNAESLQTGGVVMWLGLTQTLAIPVAVWALLKKKVKGTEKTLIVFGLMTFAVSMFFMTPVSKILWEHISFLRQFQFPWRLLASCALATAVLSLAYPAIPTLKTKAGIVLLLVITMLSTLYYWNPPLGFDKIDEGYFWDYPLNTTFFGEADVIWSAGPAGNFPKDRIEVVSGHALVTNFVRHTDWHTFTVEAHGQTTLVSHTQYFPGWRVVVDGQKVPIQFQDQNARGLLLFTVPDGIHTVEIRFGRSKTRLAAELISVITALSLIGAIRIWGKKKLA